jgi:hypothetical protein
MTMEFAKHQQLMLKIDSELRYQQDEIITRIRQMVEDFQIGGRDANKGPFRNALNVAMEATSSLEVIRNYIVYQRGRENNPKDYFWKTKNPEIDSANSGKDLADSVIAAIDNLIEDVDSILKNIEEYSIKEGKQASTQILPEGDELVRLRKDLHLKLVRLYFGYLCREYIGAGASSSKSGNQNQKNSKPSDQKSPGSGSNSALERPNSQTPKPVKRK